MCVLVRINHWILTQAGSRLRCPCSCVAIIWSLGAHDIVARARRMVAALREDVSDIGVVIGFCSKGCARQCVIGFCSKGCAHILDHILVHVDTIMLARVRIRVRACVRDHSF